VQKHTYAGHQRSQHGVLTISPVTKLAPLAIAGGACQYTKRSAARGCNCEDVGDLTDGLEIWVAPSTQRNGYGARMRLKSISQIIETMGSSAICR